MKLKSLISGSRTAFTLIEVVIVIGISMILTGVILGYGVTGRDLVYLDIQKAQIAQIISKAKSLAVSTYNQGGVPCGYGVWFNYDAAPPEYEIFSYKISPCPTLKDLQSFKTSGIIRSPSSYDSPLSGHYALPANLAFGTGADQIRTIFFIPPDPLTLIWKADGSYEDKGNIYLETAAKTSQVQVGVNSGGQITF